MTRVPELGWLKFGRLPRRETRYRSTLVGHYMPRSPSRALRRRHLQAGARRALAMPLDAIPAFIAETDRMLLRGAPVPTYIPVRGIVTYETE